MKGEVTVFDSMAITEIFEHCIIFGHSIIMIPKYIIIMFVKLSYATYIEIELYLILSGYSTLGTA